MSPKTSFAKATDDRFIREVRGKARRYLANAGVRRRGRYLLLAKGGAFFGSALLAYAGLLSSGSGLIALGWATAFTVSALLLAINVGHDGSHGALTGRPALDHAIQDVTFALLGVDGYLWRLRHNKSHHVVPNVNGGDIDIDRNPFFRLSPNQPHRPHFRWQHLYAPFIYCLVALHTIWWQDFVYLFKRDLANLRDIQHAPWRHAQFAAAKVAYLVIVLILPAMVLQLDWWQAVLGYGIATFAASMLFVFLLIGTHFSDRAAFPAPDASGRIGHSWWEHVLLTSVDWNPASRLAGFFAGGANAHVAHHLFPGVTHVHYPILSRLAARAATRHGLPYKATTLSGSVAGHFRFLRKMAGAAT